MNPFNQIYPENADTRYQMICDQMKAVLEGETDWVANFANAAALLYSALPNINWVGFYRMKNGELLLGPFQGKPACIHIAVGKGVCGTAVQLNETQMVSNVHDFPGHIACDSDSASELVIPLRANGVVVGVLDIDSPVLSRFNTADARSLEVVAEMISASCKWTE